MRSDHTNRHTSCFHHLPALRRYAFSLSVFFLAVLFLSACENEKAPVTPAEKMIAAFKEAYDETLPPAELIKKVSASGILPFEAAVMPIAPGFLNGFTGEIQGFKNGAMLSPVIGAIPFIAYVFELPDKNSAASFAKTLTEMADLRWNVCTEADEIRIEISGNTVFFVMSPLTFDE